VFRRDAELRYLICYTGRGNNGMGFLLLSGALLPPPLQRFISEDPLGEAGGGVNLYAYVTNNAVNRRDPLGLATAGFGGTLQGGILARLGLYLQGAVVVDTKGSVALTVTTPSSGSSLGFEGVTTCVACISGGGAFQFSPDAKDVHALGSAFETLSLGLQVAPGLQGTIEVDRSPTANVINVGASIGRSYPDIPISVTKVTTTTVVDVQSI
jgi:RHS repeat-associated protein